MPFQYSQLYRLASSLLIGALFLLSPLEGHSQSLPAAAQTPPPTNQIQYQALVLDDSVKEIGVEGKSYLVRETKDAISLQTIVQMVKTGTIQQSPLKESTISLPHLETGSWMVLPVINNSSREIWTFGLGGPLQGRVSPLKDLVIYNLSTNELLVNSQNQMERKQNLGNQIALKIPKKTTSFLIFYFKPIFSTTNHISPTFYATTEKNPPRLLIEWLPSILAIAAFLTFLKLAKDTKTFSSLFTALSWLSASIPLTLSHYYLYVGGYDTEMIIPLCWLISSLLIFMGFLSVRRGKNELPLGILGGLASAIFMSGLVGVIILKSMPLLSVYLIYGSMSVLYLTMIILTWGSHLREVREPYLPLSYSALFLFSYILSINLDIALISTSLLLLPEALVCVAAASAIFSIPAFQVAREEREPNFEDKFAENKIGKREVTLLQEAKEKSEHRRLMQVIEQERKVMSELQVKTAQQNEEMRKAKEAADEANRAKSAFLAVVSHEIRTPMTGVMGMLRLLQDTQLSKDQKEYTNTIKDSGDAMLALLNDILDFEKIESGKMDLESISFDLKRLLRSVYTLMRGHAEAKNVELILELDSNVPNWVYGDPTRLRQVLLNLINNAIKFTGKGKVHIRVRDLTGESDLSSQSRSHQIYFAVQDSGIGINAEAQKRLFMPFAQADSSINRKYGGTGLGLAICKRLIEAMGGAISINSKEGEGCTFFFTIAMDEGLEGQDSGADNDLSSEPISSLTKGDLAHDVRVLIVDDNGINQKVVSGFVDKLGGQSLTAGTGADALDMLSQHQFDLILLDIELPDMNGIEVTRYIRGLSIPNKANVPIVALTGNVMDEDVKSYLDAGMNDVAAKPITFEKIAELLRKASLSGFGGTTKALDIDFSESDEPEARKSSPLSEEKFDKHELSPLMAYTSQLEKQQTESYDFSYRPPETPPTQASQTSSVPFSPDDIDLDEEEDSFTAAVKKFEEMEENNQNANAKMGKEDELALSGLDRRILESLRSGLSTLQILEILVGFYEKADELIVDIGQSYLDGDMIGLNARAHELKGMAGNFGFAEVSRMCGTIEKAAKENTPEQAKDAIQNLGEKYAMARGQLNKWLSEK